MAFKKRTENKDLRDLILDNIDQIKTMYVGPNGNEINIDFMTSIREDTMYVEIFIEGDCVAREFTKLPDEFDFVDLERELLLRFIKLHMIFPSINYLIKRTLPISGIASVKEHPLTPEESYES